MATVEQNRPKVSRAAERDPQVYHPLDRLRSIIRRYVVIEGVLTAILFVAAWFTLGLILDYGLFKVAGWDWAQDGARWVRGAALVVALALLIGILVFRIVRRLTTEFSYASLALVLERRFPKVLGDRLITAVEMADVEAMGKFGYSKDMLRATIAEARERVGKVPVSEVFNWKRLWVLGFLTVGLLAATVAFSYAAFVIGARSASPVRFGWKFAHVTGIFAERNLALMNTPWPRRAHLELVGFPETGELTVGRDDEPPQLKVRAHRWVIADRSAPAGWRPLLWSDLTPDFVGRSVPALPKGIIDRAQEPTPSVDSVELLAHDSGGESNPTVVATREAIRQEMNTRVEDDAENPGQKRTVSTQDFEELQEVFKALIAKADQPSMGRTLRRLDVPSQVTYKYSGKQLAGNGDFNRLETNNEFVGQIRDKNNKVPPETVEFIVRAEDFVTPPRSIRPIPPPTLRRLAREQAEPAYLHHAPPQGLGYNALEGRLQKVAAKDLSLTGDRTVFVVPAGTEISVTAEAYTGDDNAVSDTDQIVSASAIPKVGRFPGMVYDAEGKPTETPVRLEVLPGGTGFTMSFKETEKLPRRRTKAPDFIGSVLDWAVAGRRRVTDFRITENVEFRVVFVNKYNVKAERSFLIQALPDQPPTVEVALDVVRKVGPFYMVTANARVPFNPDSFIKDDRGLSSAEYYFEYWPEDSDLVRGLRTKYAMRSLLDVPLPGTMPTGVLPRLHADNFRFLDKADNRIPASVFISEYRNQFSRLQRPDSREAFEAMLAVPKAEDTAPQTVKKIELKDVGRDYFDLKELQETKPTPVLNIKPKEGDTQSVFRLDLIVQATDNNVDNDAGPKVTKNAEKISFRIVTEGELLGEIGKEEEVLALRLEEALVKLAAAKRKYEFVRNTNGYKDETPDQVDVVKVRSQDALGDVDKARDIVQSVGRELQRLYRECQVNRLNEAALERYRKYESVAQALLAEPTEQYKTTFPKTLFLLNNVQNALNTSRWAPLVAVTDAEMSIYQLEGYVSSFRKMFGEAGSIDKLKKELERLKERQAQIRTQIVAWKTEIDKIFDSRFPTFGPVGVLTFAKGESKKITQTIQWNQYKEDDIVVKLAVYDLNNNAVADALTVPAELKLNFERHQFRFDYDVKAGNKAGKYKVRLTPAVGPPMDYEVIVE